MSVVAYCWRSGVIEIGPTCPKDALPLIAGPEDSVRGNIQSASRRAYDGVTMLVPGIPEAGDDDAAAYLAAERFAKWLAERETLTTE